MPLLERFADDFSVQYVPRSTEINRYDMYWVSGT